jgi:alpha-amylase
LSKVSFAILVHSHQPVGNFEHVLEEAYRKSYAPFLRVLDQHPRIRMSLHYSGILLEWFEKQHPEIFDLLKKLVRRKQVEMVGGGYYEPILPAISDRDKRTQLDRLADYLEKHFGRRPRGAWVAERVWEPALARPLSEAGVDYVVLDDTHFLAAGLEPRELYTSYITEEQGSSLRLIPSLKLLRYTMPFQDPEATLNFLREGQNQEAALFAVGDDCEKFGVWPGTYDHCYTNGWLERFLRAVESSDWIETTTLSAYLDAHPPRARVYLPTASYPEMMEWALPPAAAREFHACLEESEHMASGERFRRFLRGGLWRTFLARYSESNQTQKLALETSRRLDELSHSAKSRGEKPALLEEARTHLLSAQCNDAYWHGIFGGLYAPHLRSAVLRHLIRAESLLDRAEGISAKSALRVESRDFDVDGREELLVANAKCAMVLRPADGGTVSSLRFKPADAELINSLRRRPEAYHDRVRQGGGKQRSSEGAASIHDQAWATEANLVELLREDPYERRAFRTYVFPASKSWHDYLNLRLEEHAGIASDVWHLAGKVDTSGVFDLRHDARLAWQGRDLRLRAQKVLESKIADGRWHLECRSSLSVDRTSAVPMALGVELVFNLLAPDAPDRYILANDVRRPLAFGGEIEAEEVTLVDEWQRVRIALEGHPSPHWWIVPLETVSQSESGFERVYQGSAILAVWKIEPPAWRDISCTLHVEITHLG